MQWSWLLLIENTDESSYRLRKQPNNANRKTIIMIVFIKNTKSKKFSPLRTKVYQWISNSNWAILFCVFVTDHMTHKTDPCERQLNRKCERFWIVTCYWWLDKISMNYTWTSSTKNDWSYLTLFNQNFNIVVRTEFLATCSDISFEGNLVWSPERAPLSLLL